LAGSAVSGELNDLIMTGLEPTGIGLQAAVHVSAAGSSITTGATMGLAVEGLRDFSGAHVNYAQAAAIGAGNGAAGYAASAASGGLPNPGPSRDTDNAALRQGARNVQKNINARQASGNVSEAGAFAYEWGGRYYATDVGMGREYSSIEPQEEVLDRVWVPAGATLRGFTHGHPSPVPGQDIGRVGVYNHFNGAHPGDLSAGRSNYNWFAGGQGPWLEGVSNPQGLFETWSPGQSKFQVRPPLW
jgi:hypothetical protein